MRSRTKWWGLLVLLSVMFLPKAASAQVVGAPMWEHPLPLMWGEKNQGWYWATEAMGYRINNVLEGQVLVTRGLFDENGSIRSTGGATINVVNTNGELLTTLFRNRGISGQFIGSNEIALTADDAAANNYRPGIRLTLGYRLQNGIAIDFSYYALANTRQTAFAGITPPMMRGVGLNEANSFLTAPFFNFSPYFAGPFRDVVSNIYLLPFPAGGGGTVSVGPTGSGAQVVVDDPQTLVDLALLRGQPVPAWGISNGAEDISIFLTQKFHNGELNARVPMYQGDDIRTYAKGGFRYMSFYERFKMRVVDQDADGNIAPENIFQYTTKMRDHFYGIQGGFGTEAYLISGFSFSAELIGGVAGQTSKETVNIDREDFLVGLKRTESKVNVTPFFQGGVYLWWYPIEGVQFRVGYEYTGIIGARRAVQPIDFNFGQLQPSVKNTYMSLDGVTLGVALIF